MAMAPGTVQAAADSAGHVTHITGNTVVVRVLSYMAPMEPQALLTDSAKPDRLAAQAHMAAGTLTVTFNPPPAVAPAERQVLLFAKIAGP